MISAGHYSSVCSGYVRFSTGGVFSMSASTSDAWCETLVYLDKLEQLVEILHLISFRLAVFSPRVQTGALNSAPVQGNIHGLGVQIDGLMTHRLIHVTVQLIWNWHTTHVLLETHQNNHWLHTRHMDIQLLNILMCTKTIKFREKSLNCEIKSWKTVVKYY